MIAETYDPVIINGFSRFTMGDDTDLSAGIRPPNVFLFGEHGGFCFSWTGPGVYEVHVMLTIAGKGRWGFAAARQAIKMMTAKGMRLMWARVHPDRPEIGVFAKANGMYDTGERLELDIGTGPVNWRIFERRF